MANHPGKSIPFEYAMHTARPRITGALIKPVGSLCNLDCPYCYYLDKKKLFRDRIQRMGTSVLETFICQYIEANRESDQISFCWHGGEPLLAGMDFYLKAVALQKKHARGKTISNELQTNGTLIDRDWACFFRDNDFLVGVSIDGPEYLHDAYRKDKNGCGSFRKVIGGIENLYRTGVRYNTLTTVNHITREHGTLIYNFLKAVGSYHMQFLPVLEYVKDTGMSDQERPVVVPPGTAGARPAPWSVSSEKYGHFLWDVFQEWSNKDVGVRFVPFFESVLANSLGVPPGICAWCETCGDNVVVEWNGDVYVCDHFVYPDYYLGNISTTSFGQMVCSGKLFRFGMDKKNSLPEQCLRCRYYHICLGECPKHRFDTTADGRPGLNSLCAGYKYFFERSESKISEIVRNITLTKSLNN